MIHPNHLEGTTCMHSTTFRWKGVLLLVRVLVLILVDYHLGDGTSTISKSNCTIGLLRVKIVTSQPFVLEPAT
jgi:hypothetical protein